MPDRFAQQFLLRHRLGILCCGMVVNGELGMPGILRSSADETALDKAERDAFTVQCNLVPLSQVVSFIVLLIVLSTLSWLLVPLKGALSAISAILQAVVIALLIFWAVRLKVRLSSRGIRAMSRLHQESLYGRVERSWQDLHSVRLRRLASPADLLERINKQRQSRLKRHSPLSWLVEHAGGNWMRQGFLIFDFRSGGTVAFPLAGFSASALEDLFIALSRWADPMALNPEVIALQRDILTGQCLRIDQSYTKMWEDSLRQRFEVTNFVPLLGGHELQDGALKVLMPLACGGVSSVYLAREKSGKRVVVKEMAIPADYNDEAVAKVHEMFAREAKILAKIDHDQIVRVLDHFLEHGRDYLVLEFVPGLSLRQVIKMHGPFKQKDAVEIGLQVAQILEYLHAFNPPIIHRDLTPDNLVVSESTGKVTLIDFGAAHEFVSKVTGTLIGKQCYIPPEQFRGKAERQSDIYALGATMHFILTGKDPEPISQSFPRQINAKISEELNAVVSQATAQELGDRLQSAKELYQSLRTLSLR